MKRVLACLLLVVGAAAQTTAVFEVADVHVSPSGASPSVAFLPGGRFEARGTTLLRLISTAWSAGTDRISGGPNWLDTDRFDVIAKASGQASQVAMRTMLQNLFTERFGLTIHQTEKPVPVFVILPGKQNSARVATGTSDPTCQRTTEDTILILTCKNMTMSGLAERLQGIAPGYFNRPVIDRSNIQGAYDFTLRWVGRGMLTGDAEGNSMSLFTVIEKQFGVKVEQQNAPLPVLDITAVNRVPTPNPEGVTEKLGPLPTAFDVADIRQSAPGAKQDFNMSNGRIQASAIALRDLIGFAWNVEDDGVRGGEKWLSTERFDIVAKTAPTASEDTLRVMIRSMLIERFGLKAHTDVQTSNAHGLTAVKPKLRTADPSGRSTCQLGVADGVRTLTCTNVTMAQFAERLRPVAQGYLEFPIVDLTELKGSYDFSLSWSPLRRTAGRPNAGESAPGGPVPAVDAPSGITLSEAVDRQLGLKLTTIKHPLPVVVVDHMERKPTEN